MTSAAGKRGITSVVLAWCVHDFQAPFNASRELTPQEALAAEVAAFTQEDIALGSMVGLHHEGWPA